MICTFNLSSSYDLSWHFLFLGYASRVRGHFMRYLVSNARPSVWSSILPRSTLCSAPQCQNIKEHFGTGGWRTHAELGILGTCLLCIKNTLLSLQVHVFHALEINPKSIYCWAPVQTYMQKIAFKAHASEVETWKCWWLQADLVLEQVCDEFQGVRRGRLPSQGLAGRQQRRLSFGVTPINLSAALHQQADQTELSWGRRTDEGAAVIQGVPHSLGRRWRKAI